MSTSNEKAMRLALEEIKIGNYNSAAERLEAALAKQEQRSVSEQLGEPVAWVDLLKEAQQIVESKFLWKRFIDGTPLANDIACWMADFAQQHTTPQQRTVIKPLTDEQIKAIADKYTVNMAPVNEEFELAIELNDSCQSVHSFARAIEAAHGITKENK